MKRKFRNRAEHDGKSLNGWTSGALIMLAILATMPLEVGSETITLSTTYPSPVGIYHRLITTGAQGSPSGDTYLNRDGGNTLLAVNNPNSFVGIGLTKPAHKLEVGGDVHFQKASGATGFFWNAAAGMAAVGSTNPQYPLDITGGAGPKGGHLLHLNSSSPDGESAIMLQNSLGYFAELALQSFGLSFEIGLGENSVLQPFMIATNGNVGIRNFKPKEALDVAGNIYVSGNIYDPDGAVNGGGSSSDARLKQNIEPLGYGLNEVMALHGVRYDWKNPERYGKGRQIGFIAQEVEKVLPELVRTDKAGYRALAYDKLTAVLVEAIKELRAENRTLEKRVEDLEKKNALGTVN